LRNQKRKGLGGNPERKTSEDEKLKKTKLSYFQANRYWIGKVQE
jgi:hypothetical protein